MNFRTKLASVIASVLILSCAASPVPAATTVVSPEPAFCEVATDYNLNWHSLLNKGATQEQIIQMHLKVLEQNTGQIPSELVDVLNYMLYLTVINKEVDTDVVAEGLYMSCVKALKEISAKNRKMI